MRDGAVEEEVDDTQEVRGSDPCKGGEITYFSGELWWIFVRSPLSLAVNLHNFTAFTAKLCTKFAVKKLTFHRLSYIFLHFFLDPGNVGHWGQRLLFSGDLPAMFCMEIRVLDLVNRASCSRKRYLGQQRP